MPIQAVNTLEKSVEHWVGDKEMVLEHSVNIVAGVGADQDGGHGHNHQQSNRAF